MEAFDRTQRDDYYIRNHMYLDDLDTMLPGKIIADPGDAGAIPVTQSGMCLITTAAAETRTLAAPGDIGLTLDLVMTVDGGNAVLTCATTVNIAGNNTVTFADAGDFLRLVSVKIGSNFRWKVAINDGAALSTV